MKSESNIKKSILYFVLTNFFLFLLFSIFGYFVNNNVITYNIGYPFVFFTKFKSDYQFGWNIENFFLNLGLCLLVTVLLFSLKIFRNLKKNNASNVDY